MELLIVILIGMIIPVFIGYKIGGWHTRKLNTTLREQNMLLQEYSKHWASESTSRYNLYGHASQQQTTNATAVMANIINLLNALQREQGHTLSGSANKTIADIIGQAKSIYPRSEFET